MGGGRNKLVKTLNRRHPSSLYCQDGLSAWLTLYGGMAGDDGVALSGSGGALSFAVAVVVRCGGALEWYAKVCFAVGSGAAVGEAGEDRGPWTGRERA